MCWQTWISSCYRCPSFQQDVMMGWRHGGMTSWWGWCHDGMVHFVEFGIWGLSVDYLVADNSLSLFFPGLPQCSLRKDFQRGAERRERCAQSTFFQLYSCLETSTDWAQWEILPSSVPGDLVERRSEWGISFWSFLWKVWRWFLKYILCSKKCCQAADLTGPCVLFSKTKYRWGILVNWDSRYLFVKKQPD